MSKAGPAGANPGTPPEGVSKLLALSMKDQGPIEDASDVNVQLRIAARQGDLAGIEAALAKGAHVNSTPKPGGTALQAATRDGTVEAMKLLLDKGANVDQATGTNTPLSYATDARYGTLEKVKLLVERGADVNHEGSENNTPLQSFLAYSDNDPSLPLVAKRLEVVKYLVSKGTDVNHRNTFFATALQTAIARHLWDVVPVLRAAGGEVDPRYLEGGTVDDYIAKAKQLGPQMR
jgi:ankyrin repeat protein